MSRNFYTILFIVLAILMVGVFIGGLVYDRNSSLLERTLDYEISDINPDAKLVDMKKHGSMFDRKQYEARIRFPNTADNARNAINKLVAIYKVPGGFLSYEEYQKFEDDVLDGYSMKPKPMSGAYESVWIQGVETRGGHQIFHIMCEESEQYCYLYVYYSK